MLRILDANLNRIGEGLRLLEDIARFVLNDSDVSEQLKVLRHQLTPRERLFEIKLLSNRRAGEDVGAFLDVAGEAERADLISLVSANSRRVQESLRVLEEIAKIPDQNFGLDWEKPKHARFALYELEQKMVFKLLRRQKREKVAGLYVIIDAQVLRGRNEVELAQQAIKGGAKIIQFRDKLRTKGKLLPLAQQLRKACAESGVIFLVNDHLDLVLASDADGLHIGQEDLPLATARKLLPGDKIVGCSAATLGEALEAEEQGADYIAVGSIFVSPSKPGTRLAGVETLREVKRKVSVPVVAIGGINEENVANVISAGADAVAVISAVLGADDVEEASRRLTARIETAKKDAG